MIRVIQGWLVAIKTGNRDANNPHGSDSWRKWPFPRGPLFQRFTRADDALHGHGPRRRFSRVAKDHRWKRDEPRSYICRGRSRSELHQRERPIGAV